MPPAGSPARCGRRCGGRCPRRRLHLFGDDAEALAASGAGIDPHPAPADSRDAFAPGSLLVVPLRIASGVRMKILEAWARGVPVVATPEAAAGLGAEPGRELLLATTAEEFAGALARLAAEPALVARLVAAGRERLAARHRPEAVADRLARPLRRSVSRAGGYFWRRRRVVFRLRRRAPPARTRGPGASVSGGGSSPAASAS